MRESFGSAFYAERDGDLVHVFDAVMFPIPLICDPELGEPRIDTLSVDELEENWVTVSHDDLRKLKPDMMQKLDLATKNYLQILKATDQDLRNMTIRDMRLIVETRLAQGDLHAVPQP